MKTLNRFLLLALLSTGLAACSSDGPGSTGSSTEIIVEKASPDNNIRIAGGAIETAVKVLKGGKPHTGATVVFDLVSGTGNLSDTVALTDNSGVARTLWFLGMPPGQQKLQARVGDAVVEFSATATRPQPGITYMGRNQYIEYQPGTLPIILSAPHGGSLKPSEIPDRTYGTVGTDSNTDDLTRRVADALEDITGRRPHLAIVRLHRSKLDANREIVEAAQGSPHAERAWNEYHLWIETSKEMVAEEFGRGFYIDMHGHGHPIQRLELGYLLNATELAQDDFFLNQPAYIEKSSIHTLAKESDLTLSELLRGPKSLGQMLVRRGYPAVPSADDPHPGDNPFFNGGYSTVRHGSRHGGPIDGVQIEHNSQGVRNSVANRTAFARALAEALVEFMEVHMGIQLAK